MGRNRENSSLTRKAIFSLIFIIILVMIYKHFGANAIVRRNIVTDENIPQVADQDRQVKRKKSHTHTNSRSILRNGHHMPNFGLGLAGVQHPEVVLQAAYDAGYHLFDTAAQEAVWYQNEIDVGKFLATKSRESLFITTKLHPNHLGYDSTKKAIHQSLTNLKTNYIDLYLIHYPFCWGDICSETPKGTWKESWRAMEDEMRQGKIRAIGVSNFHLPDLEELMGVADILPDVVQAWFDPFHQEKEIRQFCAQHKIVFQAYSILGTQYEAQGRGSNPVLTNSQILKIAEAHSKSAAAVVLKWALVRGVAVIPRSNSPEHIKENYHLDDFSLSEEELAILDDLDGRK